MIKVLCSFYDEQSSPNKTVSLLGSVVCPDCHGNSSTGVIFYCKRCGGDKLLTNQLQFNSNLMECAISPSFAKEQGWKLGDVIRISYCNPELSKCEFCVNREKVNCNPCVYLKQIYVRITDIMKDNLCKCGHTKDEHNCKTRNDDDCEYCLGDCKILDECEKCNCKQYEPRSLDLTRFAFSQLSSLEKGLIECTVEKI